MRLVGIALLAFLIAAAAIVLSDRGFRDRKLQQIGAYLSEPQVIFETGHPASVSLETAEVTRFRPHGRGTILLSGLPAYQNVAFSLPVDTRPQAGYLQIDATLQVLAGVKAALRISINSARRGELLLDSGETRRSVRIPLMPDELSAPTLQVSFSLQGNGTDSGCVSERNIGAVVEIERSSGLYLALDAARLSTRDQLGAWGQHVYADWPDTPGNGDNERGLILALAGDLGRKGHDVTFAADADMPALSIERLREVADLRAITAPEDVHASISWPLEIAQRGANAGVRRFHQSTSWRTRYRLREIATQDYPRTLELSLMLGPRPDGAAWLVFTTLNGRTIQMDTIRTDQSAFRKSIPVPADSHESDNVLQVTVAGTHTPEGRCGAGPELLAEMRPETHLTGGGARFSDELRELRGKLADAAAIQISIREGISAADATAAAGLIAEVAPDGAILSPTASDAGITVLGRKTLDGWLSSEPPSENRWLVFRGAADAPITIADLNTEDIAPLMSALMSAVPVALLVQPGQRGAP